MNENTIAKILDQGSALQKRVKLHACAFLTHSEQRPQNIYSQEEMNL